MFLREYGSRIADQEDFEAQLNKLRCSLKKFRMEHSKVEVNPLDSAVALQEKPGVFLESGIDVILRYSPDLSVAAQARVFKDAMVQFFFRHENIIPILHICGCVLVSPASSNNNLTTLVINYYTKVATADVFCPPGHAKREFAQLFAPKPASGNTEIGHSDSYQRGAVDYCAESSCCP